MIPSEWRTASDCNGASSCVAVACTGGEVWVRDSKLGDDSSIVRFTVGEWWSYIAAVRSGHAYNGPVADGIIAALQFDEAEWGAFLAGVRSGDFDPPRLACRVVASDGDGPGSPPATPLANFGVDSAPA